MQTLSTKLLAALVIFTTVSAHAGEDSDKDLVQATLLADVDAVAPGKAFTLGVRLNMKPHWHTYWVNPGETGDPTRIRLTGPAGFEFGEIQWPLPTRIEMDGAITYGYENEVLLLVPVNVSKDLAVGGDGTIEADVSWLSCKQICVQGNAKLKITLPVKAQAREANHELFDEWRKRLPISRDHAPASVALSKVEQGVGGDGAPLTGFTVEWKQSPRKVEWFPISTAAVAIENVVVNQDGPKTRITFKRTIYKPEQVPDSRVDSVLVFEDATGGRYGIKLPIGVIKQR